MMDLFFPADFVTPSSAESAFSSKRANGLNVRRKPNALNAPTAPKAAGASCAIAFAFFCTNPATALIAPATFSQMDRNTSSASAWLVTPVTLFATSSSARPSAPNAPDSAAPTPENESRRARQYCSTLSSAPESLSASPWASMPSSFAAMLSMAEIPASDSTWNAGMSLLAIISFAPSSAWPIVFALVASFVNSSLVPTSAMVARKSFVATLPSCTSATNSAVVFPMARATAAMPAGLCSSISLKSSQATFGFAAICVAWVESVFIACCGFSAAAARPPNPLTRFSVFSTSLEL